VRRFFVTGLVMLVLGGLVAVGQGQGQEGGAPAKPNAAAREEAALAFVRENHPELAELLEQLKAMKPDQYQRAINELWQVTRQLAAYKKNEERRYQPALDVWKARSRAQLVAAQMAGGTRSPRLEAMLREALKTQLEAEIHQQRNERELVKERLKKLDEAIDRLESRRDKVVESRYQALLKKAERARRAEAGQATPSAPATQKGENQE
jgi:hypothetical protein